MSNTPQFDALVKEASVEPLKFSPGKVWDLARKLEESFSELGRRYDRIAESQREENYEELLDSRNKWAELAKSRLPEGRDAVLEEAAKLCDELDDCSAGYAAERIRELKGGPQPQEDVKP